MGFANVVKKLVVADAKHLCNLVFVVRSEYYETRRGKVSTSEHLVNYFNEMIGDGVDGLWSYQVDDGHLILVVDTQEPDEVARFMSNVLTNTSFEYTYAKATNGIWRKFIRELPEIEIDCDKKVVDIYWESDPMSIEIFTNKMRLRSNY